MPERSTVAQATNINAFPVSLSPDGRILRLAMDDAPPQPLLFASSGAVARYGVAILCVGASLAVRKLLYPLLGPQDTYLTAFTAIVFVSWYCGFGPAVLLVVLAAIGSVYFFVPPLHSFTIHGHQDAWALVGFLLFSSLIVLMGEANRRSITRREAAEDEASEMRELLEQRIQQRTQELEKKTAEVVHQAKLLDSANDAIFVRSKENKIAYWNQGATRLYGWQEHEVLGQSLHDILQTEFPVPISDVLSSERDSWEGELCHRKRDGGRVIVASRWTTLRDAEGKISGWLEINTDITSRKRAEDAARRLGGRMLQLQDAERRKFARELHDGVGQYLASIKMFLDSAMRADVPPEQQRELLAESASIVEKCLSETRTVSHLLHPPLLDEAGLASAIQWYAEGFSERSGIRLDLALQPDLGRLPSDVEITLFRVLQEGLTNIHRHSRAAQASVEVVIRNGSVRMQISDSGCGIPQDLLREWRGMRAPLGVGMAGMLERTRDMGGSFDVQSGSNGTTLTIVIPIGESAVKSRRSAAPEAKHSSKGVPAA
jgi:PAS domain S-box-containing protein